MSYNSEHYPNIIHEPKRFIYNDDEYILYKARFSSLYSLYNYLKSEPKINDSVFSSQASLSNGFSFAGKPYIEALEDLILPYPSDYNVFLSFQNKIKCCEDLTSKKYVNSKSVCGGSIDIPSFCAGSPLCFNSQKVIDESKFIKLNMTLSYNYSTEKAAVFNRSIILANIISALERSGYSVALSSFEISKEVNEYVLIEVKLKNFNEKTNLKNIYKTTCRVEFLRRILFRVLETIDVERRNWGFSYGRNCDENEAREILKIDKNSLYYGTPSELGIYGKDLSTDFMRAISHLKLEDKIDVDDSIERFKKLELKK